MSDSLDITLHASGQETSSGSGTAVDLYGDDDIETRAFVRIALVVSAFSATSLAVVLQTSSDSATWEDVASFTSATATVREELLAGDCQRYIRITWTLTGASATFSVLGTGESTYCPLADLCHANVIPSDVTIATKIRYLLEATDDARGYLLPRSSGTITSVGSVVRKAVAKMAVCNLLVEEIGLNPQSDAHVALFTKASEAKSRLKDISAGRASADFTDSTTSTYEGTGSVSAASTAASAGWGAVGIR